MAKAKRPRADTAQLLAKYSVRVKHPKSVRRTRTAIQPPATPQLPAPPPEEPNLWPMVGSGVAPGTLLNVDTFIEDLVAHGVAREKAEDWVATGCDITDTPAWSFQLGDLPPDDQESHRIAREALLKLLRGDPRVKKLEAWNGMMGRAIELAARGDQLAKRCGKKNRGEFYRSSARSSFVARYVRGEEVVALRRTISDAGFALGEAVTPTPEGHGTITSIEAQLKALQAQLEALQADTAACMDGTAAGDVQTITALKARTKALTSQFEALELQTARVAFRADKAAWEEDVSSCLLLLRGVAVPVEGLVYGTWELPWPWLVSDICHETVRAVMAVLFNRIVMLGGGFHLDPPISRVPDPTRVNRVDLPPDLQRLLQELATEGSVEHWKVSHVADLLQRVASKPRTQRGVRPRDTIGRDVEWFYRSEIKDPKDSIRALAAEYHASTHQGRVMGSPDHRSTIHAGIRRAKHLLGDVPLFIAPL